MDRQRCRRRYGRSSRRRARLPDYIGLLLESEDLLARAFQQTGQTHANTPDMPSECALMAGWSREVVEALRPFVAKYGERLEKALIMQRTSSSFDLLRDLQDLFLLTNESLIPAAILGQAAAALQDGDLRDTVARVGEHNDRHANGSSPAAARRPRRRWWCRGDAGAGPPSRSAAPERLEAGFAALGRHADGLIPGLIHLAPAVAALRRRGHFRHVTTGVHPIFRRFAA